LNKKGIVNVHRQKKDFDQTEIKKYETFQDKKGSRNEHLKMEYGD